MNFFLKARGILGINARNLDYIAKYNTHTAKKMADNKVFTKHFLSSRGIGVAKLYHLVKNYTQLTPDFFDSLPNSFVIKPNKGLGGGGILVIVDKKGSLWITASGNKLDQEFLYRHCIEILDGKYAISGTYDSVIFEERLEPHPDFRKLTNVGLPDVRVIVFNGVPVLAMLRVPTYESDGKANMEIGAIGLGIDLGTGRTTGGAQYSRFVTKMPNGASTVGFQVPMWEKVLLSAARIQNATKIGFIGVDLVVTKTGMKVLEINARSGLKIQIANKVALKTRLEKVADLKVMTPRDGVEIAQTLFSQKSSLEGEASLKPVIGIFESVMLNAEKPQILRAKIDLLAETNVINLGFYDGSILDVTLAGQRLKLPVEKGCVADADMVLAGKFLTDFYIDPSKKETRSSSVLTSQLDEKMIRSIDEKICETDEKIKLLSFLNPKNLEEQRVLFLANPELSPRFFYRECDLDLDQMRRDLKKIPEVNHTLMPLFRDKIREIESKLNLIESVGEKDFEGFSRDYFGTIPSTTYQIAAAFIQKHRWRIHPDKSPELDTKTATATIENFLRRHKLSHWKVKIKEDTVADIQVTKQHSILLKKDATFQESRLKALLAHEIGTHIFRFENGRLQPFRIFERGTAGYLRTEEGLAIWNQNQLKLDLGEKFLTPTLQVVAIHLAKKMSFSDVFQYLRQTYDVSEELAWKLCVKAKRGLVDTALPGAFTKDALYFLGLQDIESFLKKGGEIKDLYIGKIALHDLKIIAHMEGLVKAKFLP